MIRAGNPGALQSSERALNADGFRGALLVPSIEFGWRSVESLSGKQELAGNVQASGEGQHAERAPAGSPSPSAEPPRQWIIFSGPKTGALASVNSSA